MDSKKALVVISFGSTFDETRTHDIGGIEQALNKQRGPPPPLSLPMTSTVPLPPQLSANVWLNAALKSTIRKQFCKSWLTQATKR